MFAFWIAVARRQASTSRGRKHLTVFLLAVALAGVVLAASFLNLSASPPSHSPDVVFSHAFLFRYGQPDEVVVRLRLESYKGYRDWVPELTLVVVEATTIDRASGCDASHFDPLRDPREIDYWDRFGGARQAVEYTLFDTEMVFSRPSLSQSVCYQIMLTPYDSLMSSEVYYYKTNSLPLRWEKHPMAFSAPWQTAFQYEVQKWPGIPQVDQVELYLTAHEGYKQLPPGLFYRHAILATPLDDRDDCSSEYFQGPSFRLSPAASWQGVRRMNDRPVPQWQYGDPADFPVKLASVLLTPAYNRKFVCFAIIKPSSNFYSDQPLPGPADYYLAIDTPVNTLGWRNYPPSNRFPPSTLDFERIQEEFRALLTEEGQALWQDLAVIVNSRGCSESSGITAAGCFVHSSKEIYINSDLQASYVRGSAAERWRITGRILDLLAHEFLHATDRGAIYQTIETCQAWSHSRSPDVPEKFIYKEALDLSVRHCLTPGTPLSAPPGPSSGQWGVIVEGLEYAYENDARLYGFGLYNFPPSWRNSEAELGIQRYSAAWYVELYAELPTYSLELPYQLENHYGKYFKDRREFARHIRALHSIVE